MKNLFRLGSKNNQQLDRQNLLGSSFKNLHFQNLQKYTNQISSCAQFALKINELNKILQQQNQSPSCTIKHLLFLSPLIHCSSPSATVTQALGNELTNLIKIEQKRLKKDSEIKKSSSMSKLKDWASDKWSFSKQKDGDQQSQKLITCVALDYAQYLGKLCASDFWDKDLASRQLTMNDVYHLINLCRYLSSTIDMYINLFQSKSKDTALIAQLSYSLDKQIRYLYPKLDKYCFVKNQQLLKMGQQIHKTNNAMQIKQKCQEVVKNYFIEELIQIYEEVKKLSQGFKKFYRIGYQFFFKLGIKDTTREIDVGNMIDLCAYLMETAGVQRKHRPANPSPQPALTSPIPRRQDPHYQQHPLRSSLRPSLMFQQKRTALTASKNQAPAIKKSQKVDTLAMESCQIRHENTEIDQ